MEPVSLPVVSVAGMSVTRVGVLVLMFVGVLMLVLVVMVVVMVVVVMFLVLPEKHNKETRRRASPLTSNPLFRLLRDQQDIMLNFLFENLDLPRGSVAS